MVHDTFKDWVSAQGLESQKLRDQLVLECFVSEVMVTVMRFELKSGLFQTTSKGEGTILQGTFYNH